MALYRRWRFRLAGLDRSPVNVRTAWAFFHLDEAAREVEAVRAIRSFNAGVTRAFAHG